jgi:hypothetical protein
MPDSDVREVIQAGLAISLSIFKNADLKNLDKYFDPAAKMEFDHISPMLNSCKLFFEMMKETKAEDWMSLNSAISYDGRAKIIGGILVTAKALYGEKGYDPSTITAVLNDLFGFKYRAFIGKVSDEYITEMADRCIAGLEEASSVLAPRKNLN